MTINHFRKGMEENLPVNQKFIFLILCDMANSDGVCWPGTWLIAKRASLSEEEVKAQINNLEKDGFISRAKNMKINGYEKSNVFIVYPCDKSQLVKTSSSVINKEEKDNLLINDKSIKNNCFSDDKPVAAKDIAQKYLAECRNSLNKF